MYCTKCGKEISDSTKFCMYCGAPVGNGASPQPETTTTSYNPGVSSEYQTIFYKGIMPSEKVLDFPVDCNTLTGSVNL